MRSPGRYRKTCIVYIMHEYRVLGEPTAEYFSLLDKGYRRWGFDQEIIFKALGDSIGKKESTKWLKNYYEETDEHD